VIDFGHVWGNVRNNISTVTHVSPDVPKIYQNELGMGGGMLMEDCCHKSPPLHLHGDGDSLAPVEAFLMLLTQSVSSFFCAVPCWIDDQSRGHVHC